MPRVPDLILQTLNAEQRRVYDTIISGQRGLIGGPLRVWLQSPEFADLAQALGAFCRYRTSLPPRLSELAILITGTYWQAPLAWHVHAPLAIKAGLDPATVEAIHNGKTPRLPRDDEAAVYAFARELTETHRVSDNTYQQAVATLGLKTVIELVGILGYYTLASMTINAFEVPLPPDATKKANQA